MIADPEPKPRQDDGDRDRRERKGRQTAVEALKNTSPASEPISAAQPTAIGQGPAERSLAILAGPLPRDHQQVHRMGWATRHEQQKGGKP
jgi:hypothetical protein